MLLIGSLCGGRSAFCHHHLQTGVAQFSDVFGIRAGIGDQNVGGGRDSQPIAQLGGGHGALCGENFADLGTTVPLPASWSGNRILPETGENRSPAPEKSINGEQNG